MHAIANIVAELLSATARSHAILNYMPSIALGMVNGLIRLAVKAVLASANVRSRSTAFDVITAAVASRHPRLLRMAHFLCRRLSQIY